MPTKRRKAKPPPPSRLAENIRKTRKAKGLGMMELAIRAGVHLNIIQKLETSQPSCTINTLLKIAHGLDVDPGALLQGVEPPG